MINKSVSKTPAMTIAEMNAHIKTGTFNNLYLLYGPEEYLKDFYTNAIKKGILLGDNFNYFKLDGKPIADELKQLCEALPMFGDKKLIVISGSGLFKSSGRKSLISDENDNDENEEESDTEATASKGDYAFLSTLPDYCYVIFREVVADKRSKLYKQAEKNGVVLECARQKAENITRVLQKAATASKRGILPAAINLMVTGISDDITQLLCELEKLILYTSENSTITDKHVREVCELSIQSKIFDLTDAVSESNRDKAYTILDSLLSDREPAQLILVMLGRQFVQLYNVKQLAGNGKTVSDISLAIGLRSDYVVRKLMSQAERFTSKELQMRVEYTLELDEAIKSGNIKDVMALELIISK